jgi:hypothetical protein
MATPGFQAETARIQVLAPRDQLQFLDIQSCDLRRAISPPEVYQQASAPMQRLGWAFAIRDMISRPFGVKPIHGFSGEMPARLRVGDMLDFFLIEGMGPDRLALTARDSHLDVMTCIGCSGNTVTIASSVVVHNAYGRAYMAVVGPAHRRIVRNFLSRLKRDIR